MATLETIIDFITYSNYIVFNLLLQVHVVLFNGRYIQVTAPWVKVSHGVIKVTAMGGIPIQMMWPQSWRRLTPRARRL